MLPECEREALVKSVEAFAWRLAYRSLNRGPKFRGTYDENDLFQAAMLGAIEAAKLYDPTHDSGANFLTYAAHHMQQQIAILYRKDAPATVPVKHLAEIPKGERAAVLFTGVYLSQPIADKNGAHDQLTVEDKLPGVPPEQTAFDLELYRQKAVKILLSRLSPRERDIVIKTHGLQGEPLGFSEIGKLRGLTRQRIDQIHKGALRKMAQYGRAVGVCSSWL